MSAVVRSKVFRVRGYEVEADLARTVALVAAQLAADVCPDPREQGFAFLAGVLSELGTLVILRCAALGPAQPQRELVAETIAHDAASFGYVLAAAMTDLPPASLEALAVVGGAPGASGLAGRCARAAVLAARAAVLGAELGEADLDAVELAEDPPVLVSRAALVASRLRLR